MDHTKAFETQRRESIDQAMSALRSNRPLRAEEICRDYLLLHPASTEHLPDILAIHRVCTTWW